MPPADHWLNESLNDCMAQTCADLPAPTARLLLNLCGSVRSLERQTNEQGAVIRQLRARLADLDGCEAERIGTAVLESYTIPAERCGLAS